MLLLASALVLAQTPANADRDPGPRWGHSRHGTAFDQGPRQRPWKMESIGEVHFPITTSVPEVQEWFDQGMALLHGFWDHEAERSFRWCAKLDPDCAMAYWGLARNVGFEGPATERSKQFLAEASKRKHLVSERERRYIELQEQLLAIEEAGEDEKDAAREEAWVRLDTLVMEFPEDIEAKALYWLVSGELSERDSQRYAQEAVLQDVLRADPDHIGALHYRVHNWDGKEGRYAIDSCRALTESAPLCGHLQHMPGHVLSGIGMWHEAAIAMDSATRVEKKYMLERRVLPKDNWNYIHNVDYLCYIQEQLGMFDAARLGAVQLLMAPMSVPDGFPFAEFASTMMRGTEQRVLLKSERWQQVLDRLEQSGGDDAENAPPPLRAQLAYAPIRALLGLGRLDEAEEKLEQLRRIGASPADGGPPGMGPPPEVLEKMKEQTLGMQLELEGLLNLAKGKSLKALSQLTEAAELQEEDWENDPPRAAFFGFNTLGEAYLQLGSPRLAAQAFERTLETVFHDGLALAGLVQAYHAIGEDRKAAEAMAALEIAWSDADPGNRWLDAARATGVQPATGALSDPFQQPMEQRRYREAVYERLGPSLYRSPRAAEILARDHEGAEHTLDEHAGRNVIVIFYQGGECLHCVEQLQAANERVEAFQTLNADIVAISKDDLEKVREAQADFSLTLLSDPDFASARRYGSYDDFEEVELHSTFLIDAAGCIHWSRVGGAPFMDFDFLERELGRLGEKGEIAGLQSLAGAGGGS